MWYAVYTLSQTAYAYAQFEELVKAYRAVGLGSAAPSKGTSGQQEHIPKLKRREDALKLSLVDFAASMARNEALGRPWAEVLGQ